MKQLVKNAGTLMIIVAVLLSCAGNPEAKEPKVKKVKSLSLDEKAKNTFKNTIMVFSGSMLLGFSEVFKGQADAFADAFNAELDDAGMAELDAKIGGLGEKTMQGIEAMMTQIDTAFDDLAETNMSIYEKLFLADIMKEGVAITEKYKLPKGFRPLSQDLSREEIKRYILKVTVEAENKEDPIIKIYEELFEWFQKVNEELKSDPDIQKYMKSLQG